MYTIWIDITNFFDKEKKYTGVPKTTQNLAKNMIRLEGDIKVELIRFTEDEEKGILTCKREKERFLNLEPGILGEEYYPNFRNGDVLFLSDNIYNIGENLAFFLLIETGLCIIPLLHDIIPVTHNNLVPSRGEFYTWIINITNMKTGIITNSHFTATAFLERFHYHYPIGYIHLGCDKENLTLEECPLPKGKNVLMVSTIEPRKMYGKTLEQFERIWEKRDDINLIIVGNKGWSIDILMSRIEIHSRRDKNLFHFEKLTEGQLAYLYKNCDLFLFSSEVEGFGLGVVEAGRFGTPLLLRDIPVFREIAGSYATYFDDFDKLPEIISDGFNKGFKRSDGMKINSWEDSARDCMKVIDGIRSRFCKNSSP